MHLPGEADAAYVRGCYTMPDSSCQASTNSRDGGLPPVMRVLFCPTGMRMHKRVINKSRGEHMPIIYGKESCFDTCGAEIDAEECLHTCNPLWFFFAFKVYLIAITITCSRLGASLNYFVMWEMRFAHFPHNKIIFLRGEAARVPGEKESGAFD